MRIAWFTPFSTASAVGDFSRHVAPALAAHADVDIWTADRPPLHRCDLAVIQFDGQTGFDAAHAGYDAVFYNIGNYLPFHRDIYGVSQRHAGIVILHDRVLHHALVELWRTQPGYVEERYVSRMAAYYGSEGARAARESLTGERQPVWERDEEVVRYPLDEAALEAALGAVTHSRAHARYLRGRWFGPILALDLPCYRDLVTRGALARSPASAGADGRLQVTTIGHVIANKQIGRVIDLLAADPELAAMVHYTVVGSLDADLGHVAELQRLLRAAPNVSAEFLGWREKEELDEVMAGTDVFVNLRHPLMETGSASLAAELAMGRPVLCFDEGCFGEVPEGAVARVPSQDFDAVARALRRLVLDADHRRDLGAQALRVAGERSEADYARALIDFIPEVQRRTPALRLLNRVAGELATMRADPRLPVFDTIAADFGRVLAP